VSFLWWGMSVSLMILRMTASASSSEAARTCSMSSLMNSQLGSSAYVAVEVTHSEPSVAGATSIERN